MNPVNFPDYQHRQVAEFMAKAKQHTPNFPTIPSLEIRKLRAKLILEEAFETVEALGFDVQSFDKDYADFVDFRNFRIVPNLKDCDIVKVIDGCADLKVVTVGTELAFGVNGKPAFEEVMESNMTKFDGGSVREDGKILKGPNYRPPNIERVLREQGWKP